MALIRTHKNKNPFKGKIVLLTITVLVLIFSLNSCKKEGVTYENFQASNINVLSFWDTDNGTSLSFSLDTSKQLQSGPLSFGNELGYKVVYSGTRKAYFKDYSIGDTIYSKDITLESKKAYSLFFIGEQSTPEAVMVEDDMTSPGKDKFKIRFANMSSDINARYDLYLQSQGNPAVKVFDAISDKTVTPFVSMDSTTQVFTVSAIQPGVDTLVSTNVILLSDRGYTYTVGGKKGGPNAATLKQTKNRYDY